MTFLRFRSVVVVSRPLGSGALLGVCSQRNALWNAGWWAALRWCVVLSRTITAATQYSNRHASIQTVLLCLLHVLRPEKQMIKSKVIKITPSRLMEGRVVVRSLAGLSTDRTSTFQLVTILYSIFILLGVVLYGCRVVAITHTQHRSVIY